MTPPGPNALACARLLAVVDLGERTNDGRLRHDDAGRPANRYGILA